jgi:hypothetical protein
MTFINVGCKKAYYMILKEEIIDKLETTLSVKKTFSTNI